jgi:hypothetical protein
MFREVPFLAKDSVFLTHDIQILAFLENTLVSTRAILNYILNIFKKPEAYFKIRQNASHREFPFWPRHKPCIISHNFLHAQSASLRESKKNIRYNKLV